ncbi:hypothetical protein ACRALDRAFT_1068279 [Sodiomyces alcalophilus JCM 7366]|uniref:uncharacterized protein n=1 Tax=Sodiomyces alcalophilus JCM 7366 TaxID=591952 RepID=UPI0039B4D10B
MDNPSPASSSDSTANTTFSPHSERTYTKPESPKYIYTTAGTIYNPKAAQPIKPPARRNRALKWPLDSANLHSHPVEVSLFPKSALEALTLRQTSSPYAQADSDNASVHPIPAYSPLQQNYDRAVTPPHAKRDYQTSHRADMSALSVPRSMPGGLHASQPSPGWTLPTESEVAKSSQRDGAAGDDDSSSNGDRSEHPLCRLSVKSLHNLASYPNPNQKKALKLIRTRRPFSNSRPESSGIDSRAATPSLAPPNFGSSDIAGRGRQSHSPVAPRPDGFHYPPPREPKNRDKFPSSRAHYYGYNRQALGEPRGEAVNLVNNHGGYNSTLATGPGAPQPLTAGPPGQRQYNPSTLDSTRRALHNGKRPRHAASEDDAVSVEFRALLNGDKEQEASSQSVVGARQSPIVPSVVSSGASAEPTVSTPNPPPAPPSLLDELRATSVPEVASRQNSPGLDPLKSILHSIDTGDKIVDTRFPGEVRKYYPYGMPNMHEPLPLAQNWITNYPLPGRRQHEAGSFAAAREELQNHNRKVYHQFHAAAAEFPGSMDAVIHQARNRRLLHSIGVIGDRRQYNAITERDPLEVKHVNSMPLCEVSEPLLSMVFATLLNNLDYGNGPTTYCPWQKPPRHAVDASCQGTFFGKSTGVAG